MIKTIKKYLSGSLKIAVIGAIMTVSANITFADTARDFMNRNNYLPGEKYRLFGGGRGNVNKLRGSVHQRGAIVHVTGPIQTTISSYGGEIKYNLSFSDHPHWEHSPFSSSASRSFNSKSGSISMGGQTVTSFSVQGLEIHPADGYDGEQGGGYPTPTGARDEYTYKVSGKESITKIIPVDKPLPTPQNNPYNPNANSDNGDNRQAENGSNDNNSRENQTRQEQANGQGGDDALTENGELKQPQDNYHGDTCIDCGKDPRKLGYGGTFSQVGCFDSYCAGRAKGGNAELWAELEGESAKNAAKNAGKNLNKQKKGKPQSNVAQNKQVNDASRAEKLTPEQRKELGKAVEKETREYGRNLDYHDIREIARDIKNGVY